MRRQARDTAALAACCALFLWPVRRWAWHNFRDGWTAGRGTFLSRVLLSTLFGQVLFWPVGYDQIGVFMKPKWRIGLGRPVARAVADRLPEKTSVYWSVKAVEIATDFGKVPIEGTLFGRLGVIPDGWAAVVTQPAWSAIEAGEKLAGAIVHPERVTSREGLETALGSIYGSLFRYMLAGSLWLFRHPIQRTLQRPLAAKLEACAPRPLR